MDSTILALVIVLILFTGISFLAIFNLIKGIQDDIDDIRVLFAQKKVDKEISRFEHKMPTPQFFDPIKDIDDLK